MAAANSYFVPGFGISRAVIQNEIRYHCGPDAIVRPYTFQVKIATAAHTSPPKEMRLTQVAGTRWISDNDCRASLDQGIMDVSEVASIKLIEAGADR